MATAHSVNFEFKNQVAPRYIQPLFLQLQTGTWYESTELQQSLRDAGLNVRGKDIVQANITTWAKIGLGEIRREGYGRPNLFRLTPLGKQISALFSTNQALFFDVIHFLFYSAWHRSGHTNQAPLWLYAQVCDVLWQQAPGKMDSYALTGRLHQESRQAFPTHDPSFSERSVRGVFPWLASSTPPFLSKCGTKTDLCSERRSYCTPQLFHLATELIYVRQGLKYGTSLTVDERHITAISQICLLDTNHFWEMASLTDMAIREFEVRKGQWGTSLALASSPRWIELPSFANQTDEVEEDNEEEEAL